MLRPGVRQAATVGCRAGVQLSFRVVPREGKGMDESLEINPSREKIAYWQAAGLGLVLASLLVLASWMIASQIAGDSVQGRQVQAIAAFEEETGIRVLRIAMTAGGGVVDLQYQVVDPDKSLIVHDDENPPRLLDAASGLFIAEPFHEHAARELHTAVTYHQLIMNGGGLLERGSKVTITVGNATLENIQVQ